MIPHALSGLSFVERFYTYPSIPSTNETAREIVQRPQKGLFCIQADRQTAGRGRRGASFFSDCEGGLWVSIVTKVDDTANHFSYNRAISLAVAVALAKCGKDPPVFIKWPNDIYWGERKICGILLENHLHYDDLLVIGFGINVNIGHEEFPDELRSIVTSVLIETGRRCSLVSLLRAILEKYMEFISMDSSEIHSMYSERLYGKGMVISINGRKGVFSSVAADGRLQLISNGITTMINSGSPVFLKEEDQ